MTYNAFKFGLNDAKVANWVAAESYGTAVDVEAVTMSSVTLETESGQLEGDDIIIAVHAKIQNVRFRIKFGFKDLDLVAAMTGQTVTDSDPNAQVLPIGRDNMAYFALCARIDAVEGGGDTQLWIPKCKLLDGFEFAAEKGAWITPEMAGIGVYEGTTHGMGWIINNAVAQTVTCPPTVYAG
jgi:hypothetical protein